jgi:hypothetical protein
MTKKEFQTHLSHLSKNTVGELLHERSWEAVKDICQQVQPIYILELGFNRGSSALMWLFNTPDETKLHSIDIRSQEEVSESLEYINSIFGKRFKYSHLNHSLLTETYTKGLGMVNKYDLIFIDGDHSYNGILRDTKNALKLNPKYIAFDDYFHAAHGRDTQKVISEMGLKIIKEYKNATGQALTKNPFYIK